MDPREVWAFDPGTVPTVQQLLRETQKARSALTQTKASGPEKWEQTAMAPCMQFFEAKFLQPLQNAAQRRFNDKARQAAAKPSLAW